MSVVVGNEHAGFNEAVLLRMLVRELTMHKETINQWQKEYDRKWDGRSKVRGLRQRLKLWEEKTHPQLLFGCQEYIIYNII